MSGTRNRRAGSNFELELVSRYNSFGYYKGEEFIHLFPKLGTTRQLSREMDSKKIDITTVDFKNKADFGLNIQAKSATKNISYPKLLSEIKKASEDFPGMPIIYHKQTERVNTHFVKRGEFIIMYSEDFELIFTKYKTLGAALEEIMTYMESIPEELQAQLSEYLKALNL